VTGMNYTLQFADLKPYADLLLIGVLNTLWMTILSGVLGLALSIALAEGRRSSVKPVSVAVAVYVELIRNTPFIIQLFFLFFGLSSLGLKMSANAAAVIALTINISAYFSEIVRAGLDGTARGHMEAARALGLGRWQAFFKVALPPALAKVYAPLSSQFVIVFLGSAVISQISAEDLTFAAQFIQSRTFRAFEVYFLITGLYVAMAFAFKGLFALAEKRLFRWREAR